MQGRKDYTEKLFISFQLSNRVSRGNLYRRLRETLDLSFLYKDTKELYGNTGNPSIDPVVFFKATAYRVPLEHNLLPQAGITLRHADFLGFDIDEELAWHSTISRTRQLYPTSLFETLSNKVFALCINSGMATGHTQAVDSAPIKANAYMEGVVLKVPATYLDSHLKKYRKKTGKPRRILLSPYLQYKGQRPNIS